MYRPLVISRSYLWNKSTNGQIQRVFWEYLYDQGVRPTIICSGHNCDIPIDSLKSDIVPVHDSQVLRYFIAFLKRFIAEDLAYVPDNSRFSWYPFALRETEKRIMRGSYDYIFSVCIPFTDHLIALKAKKKFGLPWIAWFYDPWFDNPYRPFKHKRLLETDRKNEAAVAKNADIIIHSNQAIYNEWVSRYGESIKNKMYVLPFVFDTIKKAAVVNDVRKEDQLFTISHIGSLYPQRDSVDFLKALNMLFEEYPSLMKQVQIKYVGAVTENDHEAIKKFNLTQITHFAGILSEAECYKYYETSDLFLAIDGKNSRNIFFPSKIMKYFYYGKPILGITPHGSALQYELERSGNYCFENEDYRGIADFLYRAITNKEHTKGNSKEYWKNFTMESVCPKYLDIVNNLLTKK